MNNPGLDNPPTQLLYIDDRISNQTFTFSDTAVLDALSPWKEKVQKLSEKVIGKTLVPLTASRAHESTLGNFVTDSMVHYVSKC